MKLDKIQCQEAENTETYELPCGCKESDINKRLSKEEMLKLVFFKGFSTSEKKYILPFFIIINT